MVGKDDVARIRALNDQMRASGMRERAGSAKWLLTPGVTARGDNFVAQVVRRVVEFDAFDRNNDPHGEHDFGAFALEGQRLFWKIDYYNRSLTAGSDDPADETVTRRVLTIMLAEEY